MAEGTAARRQFVKYSFFKLDRQWRQLPPDERQAHKAEFAEVIEGMSKRMLTRTFSLVGMRGDCDFLIWTVNRDFDVVQRGMVEMRSTRLGAYLDMPHSFLATTRHSVYVDPTAPAAEQQGARAVRSSASNFLFVYPFIKNRDWYMSGKEQRQAMMDVHIEVGRRYPEIRINTAYSFGLDDQEFVVSFDGDNAHDFLDLVMELRETLASTYTVRDTPSFTCRTATMHDILESLG